MKKILLIAVFFTSCSISLSDKERSLDQKSSSHPFFNINFGGFGVSNENSNGVGAQSQDHFNAKRLTVGEKRLMLDALDRIRFVINTPEFAEAMKANSYIAGNSFSGPNGNVTKGQAYPDNNRLLKVIQDRIATVVITKASLPRSVFAEGVLPTSGSGSSLFFFNAYVGADEDPLNSGTFRITFHNRSRWNDREFIVNEGFDDSAGFIPSVVFHEILHNMGFVHAENLDIERDTVYQLQTVLERVINDRNWQNRYSAQLAQFRPFYPLKHEEWIVADTVPARANISSPRVASVNLEKMERAFARVTSYMSHSGFGIECIYDEDTQRFVMRVAKKGKYL